MLKPVSDGQQPVGLPPTPAQAPDTKAAGAVNFARQLQATHHKVAQHTMVAFLADIDEQGKRLAKSPIRAEIERYRLLVGKFVKEALAQMTQLESRTDRRNRAFILVKEIDKKLAELTEMLLTGQSKQIDILAKLDEIHGMLIDLTV